MMYLVTHYFVSFLMCVDFLRLISQDSSVDNPDGTSTLRLESLEGVRHEELLGSRLSGHTLRNFTGLHHNGNENVIWNPPNDNGQVVQEPDGQNIVLQLPNGQQVS